MPRSTEPIGYATEFRSYY